MKLSIIIPVFNEERTIAKVLETVASLQIPDVTIEIIVVDDGSTDSSKLRIQDSNFEQISVYHHKNNIGKGGAIVTGLAHATGDYIVIQDADLEYDPAQIALLIAPIQQGKAKVVYGTRLKRWPHLAAEEQTPLFLLHFLGNRMLSFITSLLYGQWVTDMETCYKIFPKDAVQEIHFRAKGFEFEPEITARLLQKGYRLYEVPIKTKPRNYKEGKKLHTVRDGCKALYMLFWCKVIK